MAKPQVKEKQQSPVPAKTTFWSTDHNILLGVFLIAFLMYANTLGHGFVLDDPLSLELNKNVTAGLSGIGDIISGGYRENNFGGQLYRPVSLVQFAIEWQISPNNPFIHHLFNILWFALSVCLVFWVMKKWFPNSSVLIPLSIALLFAVHPIHTEVVANIKSRDEIMSLFFMLLALLSWDRYMLKGKLTWLISTIIVYFLALMSKETAITMFPVFGLAAWFVYNKPLLQSTTKGLVFFIPVILLLIIRQAIFGDSPSVPVDIMDNPIVGSDSISVRLATASVILLNYLKLLFIPYPLSSDYSFSVIPLAGLGDFKVYLSLLLHLALFTFAILNIQKRKFLSFSIFGYLMALSLFSQIVIVIGTMFAERLVYLASFWWSAGIIYLIASWLNLSGDSITNNKSFLTIIGSILLVFSFLTIQRNLVWKDNLTLFTTDVATYPQSVRLNNGAAESMVNSIDLASSEEEKANILAKAEEYCMQIMKIKPVATAYLTLGNIRLRQKKYEEAIKFYDQVNDLESIVSINTALAYRELGRIAGEKEQNIQKSQDMLSKSMKLNGNDAETWFLMGVSYGVSGSHQLAAEHFEKAYTINPSSEYAKNVIMAYKNLGNQAKVEQYQKLINPQ
jgi:tetratricopeptide (TPR) repeat protein